MTNGRCVRCSQHKKKTTVYTKPAHGRVPHDTSPFGYSPTSSKHSLPTTKFCIPSSPLPHQPDENMASDSVRRIMAEVKELSKLNNAPNTFFHAAPLESDLFEWHFTVRGPPDTPFEGGVYHGRILLPAEYPLKPPEIILLTPNGRFETGKRICLSVTAHHQETWQPSWGIRTIITALVGFMPSRAEGVGALDYPDDDRRALARRSVRFRCERCGICPAEQLPPRKVSENLAKGTGKGGVGKREETATLSHASRSQSHASASSSQSRSAAVSSSAQTHASSSDTQPQPREDSSTQATPRPVLAQTQHIRQTAPSITRRQQSETQERELLYLAYAIAVVMAAVIIRRIFKLLA